MKWYVLESTSVQWEASKFNVPLKVYLNLCLCNWLKANLSYFNNFIPNGPVALNIFLSTGIKMFTNALQITLLLLGLQMFGTSLFYLLINSMLVQWQFVTSWMQRCFCACVIHIWNVKVKRWVYTFIKFFWKHSLLHLFSRVCVKCYLILVFLRIILAHLE